MTVSRPSLRIRRGRWRTRALAASPTAAEHTARCSTGVRRAPKNSSAMARSCSSHCSTSSADVGAGARASNSSARRRAVRRWTGMLRRWALERPRGSGCRWRSCPFQRTIMGSPSRNVQYHPPRLSEDRLNFPQPHSPSLPTHCSGKSGMRPVRPRLCRSSDVDRRCGRTLSAVLFLRPAVSRCSLRPRAP